MSTHAPEAWSGPYQPSRATVHAWHPRDVSSDVAGPFAPDWRDHVDAIWREHGRRDGRIRRRPRRAALYGDGAPPEIGFEEWGHGCGTVAAVSAPRVAGAAPPPIHADDLAPVDSSVVLRLCAAAQLEAVARRVRAGELRPLGLTAGTTEAGTLAATLAALLATAS